jgi:hypothetical protein
MLDYLLADAPIIAASSPGWIGDTADSVRRRRTPFGKTPWSGRLRRALRPVAEQSPAGACDTKTDEDREAEHRVRRACTLVERDSRPDHRHREPDEERDQLTRSTRRVARPMVILDAISILL